MNKHLLIVLISSLSLANFLYAQSPDAGIWSEKPAEKWQDALVTGNGTMGVMVFGDPYQEKVIFNHEFLYEYIGSEDVVPPDISPYFDETRDLLIDGKYREAVSYSLDMAKKEGYPGLLWTDPYHPAYALEISQPKAGPIGNYKRSVNFETGEVTVSWEDEDGQWRRRLFISRTDDIIVQKIENLSGNPVELSLNLHHQKGDPEEWTSNITDSDTLLIHEPQIKQTRDWLTFRAGYALVNRGYEGATRVIAKRGSKLVRGGKVQVKNAEEVILISQVRYLNNFDHSQLDGIKQSLESYPASYEELLKPHADSHREIFKRTDLRIGQSTNNHLSTEALFSLQEANPDSLLPGFIESLFDMGKYVLITSNGDNPPNLVGLWTGSWRPKWSGDFTLDTNVNLQVAPVNMLNMPEALDSYMNLIERIAPDWETNAEKLYGMRGYLSGTRTSGRRNLHTHFSNSFPGHFWTSGAQWLIYPAYEYYQTTGDEKFLRERLLPMMEKVAMFYEDFLTKTDSKGDYIFAPSFSPENSPANVATSGVVNATIDIAAAKQALENIIFVYKELDLSARKVDKWQSMLDKFPPYLVNNDGALKEWAEPGLNDNYQHRHAAHMYPVWPAHEFSPEKHPQLFNATKKALEMRGDGDLSAHGIIVKSLAASRLKMDEFIQEKLLQFLTGNYFNRSLVTNHNPGITYNTDAISAFPGLMAEVLVYSKLGEIELLPALPRQLKSGTVEGLLTRTQVKINNLSWDLEQNVVKVELTSDIEQDIRLRYRNGITHYTVTGANVEQIDNGTLEISLFPGKYTSIELQVDDQF
ncbi:glycoside hydrolase N-terminal domain-containing protein [Aliifodinibius sp. S!AR15-10]|uniref:glycosyl hydrolase family 95 catalytic domain-containing protein n=1 Tax=Aliifodinibius sp. S!AR15-10 TaxID=2950437 RepID=UPI00286100BB|nr:glycoside hydrolase N-terminal domain-containing protein [Aliifodinibius sp. S!AR15-10]MDR8394591.1 glycoside hydrolase N-terminal domain-containing protein [Aliifodinibius sp. S!AR15-10]